jgi:hypothetical protein
VACDRVLWIQDDPRGYSRISCAGDASASAVSGAVARSSIPGEPSLAERVRTGCRRSSVLHLSLAAPPTAVRPPGRGPLQAVHPSRGGVTALFFDVSACAVLCDAALPPVAAACASAESAP